VTGPANRHAEENQPPATQRGNTGRLPEYVIVISELRDQPWSTGRSLDQALGTGRPPARDADADLEAEP
jgi:hypothetical protein